MTDREEAEALRVELDRHRDWSEGLVKKHAALVGSLEAALKLVRRERDEARGHARVLAHSYVHDSRPPQTAVTAALDYPIKPE